VSKSCRNAFKTRSPNKPIRMGWNVYRLCDQGEVSDGFCLDALVSVGSYTYENGVHEHGKRYTLLYKFLHDREDGTTCAADSAFYCPRALHAAKRVWQKKKRLVFTVPSTVFCSQTYQIHFLLR